MARVRSARKVWQRLGPLCLLLSVVSVSVAQAAPRVPQAGQGACQPVWTSVANPAPAKTTLRGVAALSTNDVWAVGGTIVSGSGSHTYTQHWDGRRWTAVTSP